MTLTPEQAARRFRKRAALVCVCMFLFGFACVPIYRIACDHGYLGPRTQQNAPDRVGADSLKVDESRWVEVQFDGSVNSGLSWSFAPKTTTLRVHPGQLTDAWFTATNLTQSTLVGQAVPSIAPKLATLYFNKTECFCFTEQLLKPGETRDMPVRFVVDPKLPADVSQLTLSYTFYLNDIATKRVAGAASATAAPST